MIPLGDGEHQVGAGRTAETDMRRSGWRGVLCAGVLGTLLATACGSQAGPGEVVTLEFFQFKSEAIALFDDLVSDFNDEHPGIRVVQNAVPDSETALRVRLVREDYPDVMTLNGNFTFGEVATAGVFYDFSDEPILQEINPATQDILDALGVREEGEANGLAYANNANGVIYNVALFEEHDVAVPETWDELLAAIDTFEEAGVQPFYYTLAETWTSLPAWNGLAGNEDPVAFFAALEQEETSFSEGFDVVAERMETLFSFGQPNPFSTDYGTGNQAFARGDVAMYLQGSWAIPAIRELGADFDIGVFPYPADAPGESQLVSGVDVALTMPREPEHPEEAMLFLEYLLRPEVVERYVTDQSAIPTLDDSDPADPALDPLMTYFEDGRVVGFSDHQVPPSIPLAEINQSYLISGDADAYLATLDNEWEKYARRRS
jgi:raffinose/stachyose/melibiose transport system substrate-binding protein